MPVEENKNIHRIKTADREIILVGTAHVSRDSADLVEKVIEEEHPDTVCVELCQSRYNAITQKANWEEMDILKIIRRKQTSLLLSQLIMASFQKKLAEKFNIKSRRGDDTRDKQGGGNGGTNCAGRPRYSHYYEKNMAKYAFPQQVAVYF